MDGVARLNSGGSGGGGGGSGASTPKSCGTPTAAAAAERGSRGDVGGAAAAATGRSGCEKAPWSSALPGILARFRAAVETELPGMYAFFEPESLHVTVRALVM